MLSVRLSYVISQTIDFAKGVLLSCLLSYIHTTSISNDYDYNSMSKGTRKAALPFSLSCNGVLEKTTHRLHVSWSQLCSKVNAGFLIKLHTSFQPAWFSSKASLHNSALGECVSGKQHIILARKLWIHV